MKVSKAIEDLVPYRPGKPISETQRELGLRQVIKLASNENPLGVAPRALEALQREVSSLNRYPDPGCYDLIQKLIQKWGGASDSWVIGNGSNELIDLLVRIFCEPGEAILTFKSAFVAYGVCARAARVEVVEAPLREDFTPDLEEMSQILQKNPRIRLVFLPNPNNPTGALADPKALEAFLARHASQSNLLIVLDEAYVDYVREPAYRHGLVLRQRYPELVVVRTFSKAYGLAGLRLGVMNAPAPICRLLHKVRNPFNVNHLAQVAAVAALDDVEFVEKSRTLNAQEIAKIESFFRAHGVSFIPSQANFVLFDTGQDAEEVFQKLLRRGVILRPVTSYGFPRHLRMSVGLPDENAFALQALTEVLGW